MKIQEIFFKKERFSHEVWYSAFSDSDRVEGRGRWENTPGALAESRAFLLSQPFNICIITAIFEDLYDI